MQMILKTLTNFSRAVESSSRCFRPEKEEQIKTLFNELQEEKLLASGNGLSYSDCCLFTNGNIIDTRRLNHFISFDRQSGIAVCQGAVTFADLFLIDDDHIPPIIPGTLYATLAGGIANDVHGKNNHQLGSLGHHIVWFELQMKDKTLRCSPTENAELFFATIGGVGLTGVITRIAIQLRRASRWIEKKCQKFSELGPLLNYMKKVGVVQDYQAAWLDLYSTNSVLFIGDHIVNKYHHTNIPNRFTFPQVPFKLLGSFIIKQFNHFYFQKTKATTSIVPLWQFNNPLDKVQHWNRVYGKKGLLQFQAVFDEDKAEEHLNTIFNMITMNQSTPTLAVLKYFSQNGIGDLSFVQPGFTIAIDFINNQSSRRTIMALNQYINESGGKVYLAKDLLLNELQFKTMYPAHQAFLTLLNKYDTSICSDLSRRLGMGRKQ